MVTFRMIEETDQRIVYLYFPEGEEEKGHGVIIVDKDQKKIDITKVAPNDFERDIPADELNELVKDINQMKREVGDSNFIEMTTEPEHSVYYGDHAVQEIRRHLCKEESPRKGRRIWY